ncbi:Glucuronyl/N-acetylglucosaminyl transferase EXT1 [Paragonimus heterotremus]|uniref:Glucuronyl/N-acetylglucosaminyl transferase EXT1 n=1 Tax=Paragonimus heterotremus TaxID=100268 RepID=A0A8J4WSY5_9TREM|nr:Glucuronyl/N-acetylglucosaminyl transferase EXT1 [Paragonimus heterotremus]
MKSRGHRLLFLICSFCFAVLLSNTIFFLVTYYFIFDEKASQSTDISQYNKRAISFLHSSELNGGQLEWNPVYESINDQPCTMDTCFDYSRCTTDLKVYIYPPSRIRPPRTSSTYNKILTALTRYKFVTDNPVEACIFIPRLDLLDRDPLSPQFVPFMNRRLAHLPYWNTLPVQKTLEQLKVDVEADNGLKQPTPGRNHLLFNLYAGTWPTYREDDYRSALGQAILAKASFSTRKIRSKFDISLPLFHPQHPLTSTLNSGSVEQFVRLRSTIRRPILLSFKGKRYVNGIGSESRNALFHLHNGDDVILVTTCRHGLDWMRHADKRCPIDMALYDKYDYSELMHNSTFCLVPRGRRLGSYRFLEALQASCIPVMLSNDWELPFSEVIDWRRALIWADERLLLTLPLMLRRIPDHQILQLRQQIAFLWSTYFQSVESIVFTTLEIIRDRIFSRARSRTIWNAPPGGLVLAQRYSVDECALPLTYLPDFCKPQLKAGFTLVIPIRQQLCTVYPERLSRFSSTIFQVPLLRKVVIVWICDQSPPPPLFHFTNHFNVPVEVVVQDEWRALPNLVHQSLSPGARFQPFLEIPTLAVFTFVMDLNITVQQLQFAYSMWQTFPHRLVGFQTASHQWNSSTTLWECVSPDTHRDSYTILQLNAAFYHRHYHYLYWQLLPPSSHDVVSTFADCEDILFNVLVGHLTGSPPVKLLTSHDTDALRWPLKTDTTSNQTEQQQLQLQMRSVCLQAFSQHLSDLAQTTFGSMISGLEMDPSILKTVGNRQFYLPLHRSTLAYLPGNQD